MFYYYQTPVGTFWIQPDNGQWGLWINGERLGYYATPAMAASDVASHVTGWYEWDSLAPTATEAADLSEWKQSRQRPQW